MADGPVAIITGASSGIGEALARELARRGYRVGLVARRAEKLSALADTIRSSGGKAVVRVADVTEREAILKAVAELRTELGPVDLMVACAGVGTTSTLDQPDVPKQLQLLRVNLFGVIASIEAVLPEMLARRSGHIAAVSSVAAYHGLPGSQAYCASKAGVNAYLEGLRIQLVGRGVHVTTICPGFVATPMVAQNKLPMPFLLTPDQAAIKIASALQRRVKVFNFPWPMYRLMRLLRWMPDRFIQWKLKGHFIPEQP